MANEGIDNVIDRLFRNSMSTERLNQQPGGVKLGGEQTDSKQGETVVLPPVPSLPVNSQGKTVPRYDDFRKQYFKERGWDDTLPGANDPKRNEKLQVIQDRLKESSKAFQDKYGKGLQAKQAIGEYGQFVFQPLKFVDPNAKFEKSDIGYTALDVVGLGFIGKTAKGLKALKFAKATEPAVKALKAGDMVQDAAKKVYKVLDTADPEILKVVRSDDFTTTLKRADIAQVAPTSEKASQKLTKALTPTTEATQKATTKALEGVTPPEPPKLPDITGGGGTGAGGGGGMKAGAGGAGGGGDDVIGKLNKMWDEGRNAGGGSKESLTDLWRKTQEKLSDKFAGINRVTSTLKKQIGGKIPEELNAEVNAALIAGVPDAAVQAVKNTTNLMRKTAGEVTDDFINAYLTLKHQQEVLKVYPKRALPGGLKLEDLTNGFNQIAAKLGTAGYKKLEQAANVVREHYASLLDNHVRTGTVSKEVAEKWKADYPWYNPIRYFEHLDDMATKGTGKNLSVSESGIKGLTELGTESALIEPLKVMTNATLASGMVIARNDAAKSIVKAMQGTKAFQKMVREIGTTGERGLVKYEINMAALQKGLGTSMPEISELNKVKPGMGTISYMEDGVKKTFEVPKWLEDEAKYFQVIQPNDLEKWAQALNEVSRVGMTGKNLAFMVPNLAIDTLTALINQGIMPWQVAKRLVLNLKGIVGENKVLDDLLLSGGGTGFWRKSPEEMSKAIRSTGNTVIKNEKDLKWLANPWNLIGKIGEAVEMAPRTAAFEKGIKAGKTVKEAALDARRVTIDFSRAGTAAKMANYYYLYLNAGIQGSLLPFRALRDSARARWFTTGLMAATGTNYAWNRQFPEYQDVPDYAKYGSMIFMLPSNEYDQRGNKVPHYIAVVPNMREFSLFTAPITYALRKLDDKAPEDVGEMLKALLPNINPLSQITETSGGVQPPTQILSTFSDIMRNNDSFRGTEIVPNDLKDLPPEKQFNEYTSETAIAIGKAIGQSPMKIDYFVKNIFGGLGQQMMSAADKVVNAVAPPDVSPRIMDIVKQLKTIQETEAPENISSKRTELLYSLSNEDRNKVLELERRPEETTPVITPIIKRLYHEQGGQIYKTGQAIAAKELGLSVEQTKEASRTLGEFSDKLNLEQEKLDKSLLEGNITPQEWREARAEMSDAYTFGLLAVGIVYPNAAQVKNDSTLWDEYQRSLYTLGMAMPDTRSRGQLLLSGYYAIKPEEVAEGKTDWTTFYQMRDEYKKNLIPEDRALLESEIKARMTPIEKSYFEFTESEKLDMYFKLDQGKARELYRSANPDLDAALNLWGYVTTIRSQKALDTLKKIAGEIGVDYNNLPYFQKPQSGSSGLPTSPVSSGSGKLNLLK